MLFANYVQAQVSGTVFRDFNANGSKEATETGVANVSVSVYDAGGGIAGTGSSNPSGFYSINPTGVAPYRVEFTNLPTGYHPSAYGTDDPTTVSFINSSTATVNLGINRPKFYVQSNPDLIIPRFVGEEQVAGPNKDSIVLQSFPYSSSGTTGPLTARAKASEIGTIWGTAYQRESKSLFLAAYQKAGAGYGPGGPAQIYRYDGNTNTVTPFLNLGTALGNPNIAGTDQHVYGFDIPANFPTDESYYLVGKMSFGDIDIDEDNKTLWVINLLDKKLYKLPLGNDLNNPVAPTSANIVAYDIPTNQPTCTGTDVRPFGLGVLNGKIYVGLVCSGETANNNAQMRMYVEEFDPNTGLFTEVINQSMTNIRRLVQPPIVDKAWTNWNTNAPYGPALWLTDIDFDENGNMFLGIRDRYPEAGRIIDYTVQGYGDVVVACYNGTSWTIENNGSCGGTTYLGAGNGQGIGGGEFYTGDYGNGTSSNLKESLQGSLLYLPTENHVISSSNDYSNLQQGSITWMSHADGSQVKGYEIYKTQGFPVPPTFGKANGLGDMEVLADPAPLEIGNRVWTDTDEDGIQDADELGIDGITVQLYEGATLVGTTLTANGGQWYFNNSNVNLNGATELKPNTAYTVRVLSTSFPSGQSLTAANNDGTSNGDVRDNDATLVGGNAEIAYTTGNYGENNHTLDMGFRLAAACSLTVDSAVPSACTPISNSYNLAVTVTYANQPTGNITINVGGTNYTFTPDGTSPDTYTVTGLASNGTTGVDVSATFVGDAACTNTLVDAYNAPVSCSDACSCYQNYKATSTAQNTSVYNTWQDAIHEVPDFVLDFESYTNGTDITNTLLGPTGYGITWLNLNGGDITITDDVASSPPIGTLTPMVSATLNTNEGDDSQLVFEVPVDYVGFYIIDLDDETKTSSIMVTFSDNTTCSFSIDHNVDNCQCQEFVGIVAPPTLQISSVTIYPNTGSRYGVDDISYGYNSTCPVEITDVSVGACSGTTATVDVTIGWSANAPTSETINVTAAGQTQTIDLATATAPTTVQFVLTGDGSLDNVLTASLSGSCACVDTIHYNLPNCAPCTLTVDSASPTTCDPTTNTYDLAVTVTYANQPTGDITINVGGTDYTFTPDGTSPDTYTVTGLASNGTTGVDVSATFVGDAACTHTLVDAYNAPAGCTIPPPPTANCCVTPVADISTNGDFETSSTTVFNDVVGGLPASGLIPNADPNNTTGNTAVPENWFVDQFNGAPSGLPSNPRGIFYVNAPSNKFMWIRNGNNCLSNLASNGNIGTCRNYKICLQVAGWSPTGTTDNISKAGIDIPGLGLHYEQDIPTTTDITAIQWQTIEYTFSTAATIPSDFKIAISTGADNEDGVILDNFQLCDMGPASGGACAPVCSLTIDSAVPTACDPATNTYDLAVTVTYANQPTGDITINVGGTDYTFTPDGTSPDTYTVTGLASNGTVGVDVSATFVGDAACTNTLVDAYNAPASCAPICDLTGAGLANVMCNNNGTDADASDDYISFTLNPTGTTLGSSYTVSVSGGSITPNTGNYGSPTTFQLQNGSAGSGNTITVTITDNTDTNCKVQIDIPDTGSCSTPACPPSKCLPVSVTKAQ